jgi:sodium/potassium-transporting ATPase subunit alpha
MAARKILVKNLSTVETLGCMSVLCSDKTGTLTLGKMTAVKMAFEDGEVPLEDRNRKGLAELHRCATLCCASSFDPATMHLPINERAIRGDGTDGAVLKFAETVGNAEAIRQDWIKIFELPFNSKNKYMATLVSSDDPEEDKVRLFVKGAPDVLFGFCSHVLSSDGSVAELDAARMAQIVKVQEEWSATGHRVLAFCSKDANAAQLTLNIPGLLENEVTNEISQGLTLLGLLGEFTRVPCSQRVLTARG